MKQSLRTKMISFFLAVVVVSSIGFGLIWVNIHTLTKDVHSLSETDFPKLKNTYLLSHNAVSQVSNIRGYIIYEKPEMLDTFNTLSEADKTIENDMISNAADDQSRELAQAVQTLDQDYNSKALSVLIPLLKAGKKDEATAYAASTLSPIGKELLVKVDAYQKIQDQKITSAFNRVDGAASSAQSQAVLFSIGAAILGILIGLFAAENISRPIKIISAAAERVAHGDLRETVNMTRSDEIGTLSDSFNVMIGELQMLVRKVINESDQVASAGEELTAGAEQSAQAAGAVAESVGEMAHSAQMQTEATISASAIIQELSGTAEEVAANTQQVAQQAHEAAIQANEGIQMIDSAVHQIEQVRNTVSNSADIVERLGEKSKEVDSIVVTISGIADQTNLLALNAAIEAARAGEQGRGFSVVAEEVRKLAEQSQDATKKIAAIIAEIQRETTRAVQSMKIGTEEVQQGASVVHNAGTAFHTIANLVNKVSDQIADISSAVEQMANGNQEVVGSINRIDTLSRSVSDEAQSISAATEEQLATMEEIASSSHTLAHLAEELTASVSQFKV